MRWALTGSNRTRKSNWRGTLHCTGWPPTKGWKWTGEENASKCLKIKQAGKSGGAARRAVGGCEGRSGSYCKTMRGKRALSRRSLLLGGSSPIPSVRRWFGLYLVGC